ncbi:hypothetical protein HGRIS_002122 [Hohenbuehelia grisea]|uniref:ubiquitinyl hydrolase 1 n=1 Tax=Hohenbuehelia grisea TaxID=104357 RepID=A0ABR3JJI5_9AGAR
MAGLEPLVALIYHEKQQEGSMLCAQHALNVVLQGNYFSAPDLSVIARNLDAIEASYDEGSRTGTSMNMDDTGFFSVQVLDNALSVWGLNLVRWRSEEMKPYQDRPHTILAFILNYQQHWFALRRFGPASSTLDADPGDGHWFNLNSFLPQPEWVGKLYLGMVLQQAEADGYSVFAVTQADPSAPLALPRTEADEVASTLPEPSGTPNYNSSRSYTTTPKSANTTEPTASGGSMDMEGLEEEDYELQAALQASLSGASEDLPPFAPPPLAQATVPLPSSGSSPASGSGAATPQFHPSADEPAHLPPLSHLPGHADLDPVTAGMERNRVMLQRMREQQEYAQREVWASRGFGAEGPPRNQQDDDEDEMLRRAIEESEAMARAEGHGPTDDGDDNDPAQPTVPHSFPSSSQHRVYDDDDAELQAALKASLENMPDGWTPPAFEEAGAPQPQNTPHNLPPAAPAAEEESIDVDDAASVTSDATSAAPGSEAPQPETPKVSMEELRQKRLARFGA